MFDLSRRSPNRFYAMHVESGKIVSLDLQHGAMRAGLKLGKQSRAAAA
jgi:hypothetical protein